MTQSGFDTIKGLGGLGAFILAQLTANLQTVEWGLRMISLLVGIGVGLVTIWSILKGKRRN